MLPAWHRADDLQIVVVGYHHLKQFLGRESKDELSRYVNISLATLQESFPSLDGWNS